MVKLMKPKYFEGKWYIEVETVEHGNVLLLKKGEQLPIPITFDSKEKALNYIKTLAHNDRKNEVDSFCSLKLKGC